MKIRIGAVEYAVRLARGYPTFGGLRSAALTDHGRRVILIADELSFPLRLHALTHEAMAAWERAWPSDGASPLERDAMAGGWLMLRCAQEPGWLAPLREPEGQADADYLEDGAIERADDDPLSGASPADPEMVTRCPLDSRTIEA